MKAHRLRRLTSWILLIWLLALGTGFANACVVREQVRQAAHSMMLEEPAQTSHPTIDCQVGHDHASHSETAPCEQFRTELSALPQTAKQQSDTSADFWLVGAPGPVLILPVPPDEGALFSDTPPRDAAGVPITIAFLRLAL